MKQQTSDNSRITVGTAVHECVDSSHHPNLILLFRNLIVPLGFVVACEELIATTSFPSSLQEFVENR